MSSHGLPASVYSRLQLCVGVLLVLVKKTTSHGGQPKILSLWRLVVGFTARVTFAAK